jgi:hypothetical protein
MKPKQNSMTIVFALTLMAALASCVDHQIEVISAPASEYIGFGSTTTRAAVADLGMMQSDPEGFSVYAVSGNNFTGWYADADGVPIDGSNRYRHKGGGWEFDRSVRWPSAAEQGFPMTFYAIYPATSPGYTFISKITQATPPMKSELESKLRVYVGNPFFWGDLMIAKAAVPNRPASGVVPLVFNHILSKINFGIIAGTGTVPYIQQLQVNTVNARDTFDMVTQTWQGTTLFAPNSYMYYNDDEMQAGYKTTFSPQEMDETTANPIYPHPHDKHLMLMPQTSSSWSPVSGITPQPGEGYIMMIYRMETGAGTPNEVGFADAKNHPDYEQNGGNYEGPLFVKTGFPLPADENGNFTWKQGRSYTYNIALGTPGSCNGYIVHEYYHDKNGNPTNLKLIEILNNGKRLGDKLQNGVVQVRLKSSGWDDRDGELDEDDNEVVIDVPNWDQEDGGTLRPAL